MAIIAPSGPVPREALLAGARELERHGLRPSWQEDLFERHRFLAGPDERRRREWERAWKDPHVRGVFAARGGAGASRLLPLEIFGEPGSSAASARLLCGFSDVTFLHAVLSSRRVVSFYGPLVAWDLARGDGVPGGYDAALFRRLLFDAEPGGLVAPAGARSVRAGVVEGRLAGGCLSLLSASLGTPEALDAKGAILFLEDEKESPYRLDRYLQHLRRAGTLAGVRGVVLGEFPDCGAEPPDSTTAEQVLEDFFAGFPGPVVRGFPIGHTQRPNLTLPLGTWARLDGSKAALELLEPAVA